MQLSPSIARLVAGLSRAGALFVAVLAIQFAMSAQAAGYEPVTLPVRATQITDDVWMVKGLTGVASAENQGFNSNAGFVVTSDGVIVFDALGTPSLGDRLLKVIRKVTDKPIKRLIISHYHSDHFYGAQAFKDEGIEITAHRLVTEQYLKSPAPGARLEERRQSLYPWVDETSKITPPDKIIGEQERFTLGDKTFRVFHSGPAHTPEDLMMLVEPSGVLFAGDLLFSGRLPWVGNADSKAWLTALEKLKDVELKFLIPGHGEASTDPQADLVLTRDYLQFLRKSMGAAVEDLLEFNEAYDETDWSRFSGEPLFDAANRRNAYNTFLLMQRESLSGR